MPLVGLESCSGVCLTGHCATPTPTQTSATTSTSTAIACGSREFDHREISRRIVIAVAATTARSPVRPRPTGQRRRRAAPLVRHPKPKRRRPRTCGRDISRGRTCCAEFWSTQSTAGHAGDVSAPVRITHPFHPQCGQVLDVVERRPNWGEDRVFYRDRHGHLASLPAGWTSAAPGSCWGWRSRAWRATRPTGTACSRSARCPTP